MQCYKNDYVFILVLFFYLFCAWKIKLFKFVQKNIKKGRITPNLSSTSSNKFTHFMHILHTNYDAHWLLDQLSVILSLISHNWMVTWLSRAQNVCPIFRWDSGAILPTTYDLLAFLSFLRFDISKKGNRVNKMLMVHGNCTAANHTI